MKLCRCPREVFLQELDCLLDLGFGFLWISEPAFEAMLKTNELNEPWIDVFKSSSLKIPADFFIIPASTAKDCPPNLGNELFSN